MKTQVKVGYAITKESKQQSLYWSVHDEQLLPNNCYICYMKWQDYIVSDNKILLGKPTIKGTRIAIDHIISLLAQGWTEKQILNNYPRLNHKHLKAIWPNT